MVQFDNTKEDLLFELMNLRRKYDSLANLYEKNINERKRKREGLEDLENRYYSFFEHANEGLLIMTLDGRLSECNQAFASMHGYSKEEICSMDIRALDVLQHIQHAVIFIGFDLIRYIIAALILLGVIAENFKSNFHGISCQKHLNTKGTKVTKENL